MLVKKVPTKGECGAIVEPIHIMRRECNEMTYGELPSLKWNKDFSETPMLYRVSGITHSSPILMAIATKFPYLSIFDVTSLPRSHRRLRIMESRIRKMSSGITHQH